jgi:hypothetical protein
MQITPLKVKDFSKLGICRYLQKKNKYRSVFCLKLDQWVSAKYCSVCRFYAKQDNYHQKPSLHNYNYNYYITHHRGGMEEQDSSFFTDLTLALEEVSS